jgi:hypothetical protein
MTAILADFGSRNGNHRQYDPANIFLGKGITDILDPIGITKMLPDPLGIKDKVAGITSGGAGGLFNSSGGAGGLFNNGGTGQQTPCYLLAANGTKHRCNAAGFANASQFGQVQMFRNGQSMGLAQPGMFPPAGYGAPGYGVAPPPAYGGYPPPGGSYPLGPNGTCPPGYVQSGLSCVPASQALAQRRAGGGGGRGSKHGKGKHGRHHGMHGALGDAYGDQQDALARVQQGTSGYPGMRPPLTNPGIFTADEGGTSTPAMNRQYPIKPWMRNRRPPGLHAQAQRAGYTQADAGYAQSAAREAMANMARHLHHHGAAHAAHHAQARAAHYGFMQHGGGSPVQAAQDNVQGSGLGYPVDYLSMELNRQRYGVAIDRYPGSKPALDMNALTRGKIKMPAWMGMRMPPEGGAQMMPSGGIPTGLNGPRASRDPSAWWSY